MVGFEHCVEDGEELVHGSDDGDLAGLAVLAQALVERLDLGVVLDRHARRVEEGFAHLRATAADGAMAIAVGNDVPSSRRMAVPRSKSAPMSSGNFDFDCSWLFSTAVV